MKCPIGDLKDKVEEISLLSHLPKKKWDTKFQKQKQNEKISLEYNIQGIRISEVQN